MALGFEDLSVFFSIDEFADVATINGSTVNGIFKKPHQMDVTESPFGWSSTGYMFVCQSSEVANVSQSDTVAINSVSYKVQDIQSDGTGVTALLLHKAS